jgi:hypothetical protein
MSWQNSLAKEMLKKDILDGLVTADMKLKQVLAMRQELYEPYAKNFAANYRSLQRSLQALHDRSEEVKRTMHGLSMIKACSLVLTWIAWGIHDGMGRRRSNYCETTWQLGRSKNWGDQPRFATPGQST